MRLEFIYSKGESSFEGTEFTDKSGNKYILKELIRVTAINKKTGEEYILYSKEGEDNGRTMQEDRRVES